MNGKDWTPGPYKKDWNGHYFDIRPVDQIHSIASVNSAFPREEHEAGDQEANARLITAAPELYEALEYAAERLGTDGNDPVIDQALAKARGEQE